MATSKEQKKLIRVTYREKKYERLAVEIPKGKRDIYKVAAQELGLSLSRLVQNGVEEYIQNHTGEKFSKLAKDTITDS